MTSPNRKRILFVDDEPPVLNLLQTLFRHVSPDWESAFTDRGHKALALMAERPFDVVVSDMRMPEMNGAELLEQVRDRFPRTARIVLSGYADQPMSIRSLAAAHQYLAKPFTLASLQSALNRVFSLDALVPNPAVQTALGALHFLPSPPSIASRFHREIVSPAATSDTLGGLIGQDPALSAKALQIVSSAFFGTPKPIMLGKEAALALGMGLLRSAAAAHSLLQPASGPILAGLDLEALVRHGVATGLRASRILSLERAAPDLVRTAFSTGLLQDIGRLALAVALPERYSEVQRRIAAGEATLLQAETDAFGSAHPQVGAYLLGLWGLPEAITLAVANHHTPRLLSSRGLSPVVAVHVAAHLERGSSGIPEPALPALDEQCLQALRIDAPRLQAWSEPGSTPR